MKILVFGAAPPAAAFFCLEPEPTQFNRRELGLPEPEPHKKWRLRKTD